MNNKLEELLSEYYNETQKFGKHVEDMCCKIEFVLWLIKKYEVQDDYK